jgi:dihydrodipicolinate reductase
VIAYGTDIVADIVTEYRDPYRLPSHRQEHAMSVDPFGGPGPTNDAMRVLIVEPEGSLNRLILEGLSREPGMEVIGVRRSYVQDLGSSLRRADVIVDAKGAASPDLLLQAIDAGVSPIVGTTIGLSKRSLDTIDRAARERGIGAVCVSEFCVGCALMAHMCRVAVDLLEDVEIIERHGDGPEEAFGPRVEIGDRLVAHHANLSVQTIPLPSPATKREISFCGPHETLTISHDESGPEAVLSGVSRAIHRVVQPDVVGLLRGMEMVLGLSEPDRQVP